MTFHQKQDCVNNTAIQNMPDQLNAPVNPTSSILVNPVPRIPDFNPTDPELWFTIVEASFHRLNVTDNQRKYLDVLAVLPSRYISEVRDIVTKPLDNNSYNKLKEQLIKRLGASQEEKTRQLLENEAMGDERPSQFLRRLQSLAGSAVPEAMVRSLWVRRLPTNLQPILATQLQQPLTDTAELADHIFAVLPHQSTIATLSSALPATSSRENHLEMMLQQLSLKVSDLTSEISSIRQEQRFSDNQRRNNGRFRSRSRSRPRDNDPRSTGICWYHQRFKDTAQKCNKPCDWTPGNATGSR